ncbi:MAG: sulfotransferase family protein, partial [Steroidobacteraceae bacterium]
MALQLTPGVPDVAFLIGAGFGRTGTTSLKMALEQLGYLSCHHMQETLRDPESWYRSTRETVYEATRSVPAWLERIPRVRMIVRLLDGIVWDGVFHGRFEDHTEDVKRSVPPGRLLVYSVREGWGPACEFLGVPVPEKMPFPHENERAQVQ